MYKKFDKVNWRKQESRGYGRFLPIAGVVIADQQGAKRSVKIVVYNLTRRVLEPTQAKATNLSPRTSYCDPLDTLVNEQVGWDDASEEKEQHAPENPA